MNRSSILDVFVGVVICFVTSSAGVSASKQASSQTGKVRFTEVAGKSGLSFVHDNAATSEKYLIETMGSGCGWIDYDQDGHLDAYLVNGAATQLYQPKRALRNALYRSKGDGTFEEVGARAGVTAEGLFGMGVAVGDYDNDTYPDLYVIGYGRSILYHNLGNGAFEDVTDTAGTANRDRWGSSGAWFDFDRDGFLDLMIANYVKWTPENNTWCGEKKEGYRAYCHPNVYPPDTPTLYRNNGDGTFADVTKSSGIGSAASNGLGVVTFDFDQDGWQDVFIANDGDSNFLFHNQKDGTFKEVAFEAGIAVGDDGNPEAGMGTDAADVDGDGFADVFMTHLDFQQARLFRNLGSALFEDATFTFKLAYATFHYSGFGTRLIDYDNDGHRDIFMANGHIMENIQLYHSKTTYAEPKLVYRNIGGRAFENVSDQLGPDVESPRVSRGAAFADFDNDGDLDVLVNNNGGVLELLRNDGGNRNHWLQVFLIGEKSNRDAVGARVRITAGSFIGFAERKGGMSYQSAHDPRLHFGLGQNDRVDQLEVVWPGGEKSVVKNLASDQIVYIREGKGQIESPFSNKKTAASEGQTPRE